ncbi:MAG: outer membrane protein transport protein [Spirochaetales bacterium]|nr:outer membrane protein transport protein [Spirochaetales bacterium]
MHKERIAMILILLSVVAALFAGGVDNKTNQNVGFVRNVSRNTEHLRPETVLYNIAGMGFMEDGLVAEVGNQFIYKKYTNEFGGTEYKDECPVFFFPNIEFVYKRGNWAVGSAFAVAGGGGDLKYDDGTAMTSLMLGGAPHSLDIYSVTFGETTAISYTFGNKLSLAAALRILTTTQSMELNGSGMDTSYEATGTGLGGIFSIHYKPTQKWDLVAQYRTITKMECDVDDKDGALAAAIQDSFDSDMPPELNLGIAYQLGKAYLSSSFNYYFNKQAKNGNALSATNSDYNDSWEVAGGVDYQLTGKALVSGGVIYTNNGNRKSVNNVMSPVTDSICFSCGGEYKLNEKLTLAGGALYSLYFEDSYEFMGNEIELNKVVVSGCISATYRFF